jgi:transcriptional regulator with XRE-family HTH domain
MSSASKILSQNLRTFRVERGFSQEELAHLSGLDRTYLSGVERGIRNPTVAVLEKIAAGLSVHPYQLLMPKDD